jgi:anhydro-N-acetylmuramic acid kinase
VLNLGGIANITWLPPRGPVIGFDCGPGNGLLDAWASKHLDARYDAEGRWGATGREDPTLLERLLDDPWFRAPPPKSTGRELFNAGWLMDRLSGSEAAADVQATLLALTARGAGDALRRWCPGAARLIACGGGTKNARLMARLAETLPSMAVESSATHGVEPGDVEALSFAWLAREALEGRTASLPSVTGARGPRVLGAIYPK